MQQKQTEDWIDYITDRVFENYKEREIVIWGRYGVSDSIKDRLKEKYGIDTAFYIDSDTAKTDSKQVFLPDYLDGKSDRYYVVIPIAFYQEIREKLRGGGMLQMQIITIFATVPCGRNRNIMRMHMEIKS